MIAGTLIKYAPGLEVFRRSKEALKKSGVWEQFGNDRFFYSIHRAVEAFEEGKR